jgi:hypothetical protein
MATNIVSVVSQFLTPDSIGRISDSLGLDRTGAQSAVGAAVPSLLAGLGTVAARPDGAQKVADAVRQQSGMLDTVASVLGTGRQTALVDTGSQLLSSLLGGRSQSALADAVGSFSGIGRGGATSLLGMLTPIVMGSLAKFLGSGFDVHNLTNMFAGQKQNIAAALPSGFASQLAGTDIFDSIADGARKTGAAAADAARSAASATSSAAYAAAGTGRRAAAGTSRWLYWAIPVLAVAIGGIYLMSGQNNRGTDTLINDRAGSDNIKLAAYLPQGIIVQGSDVGKAMTDSLEGLRATLASVTDEASAEKALPRLGEITAQVDKIASLKSQLSPEQRSALAGMIRPGMTAVGNVSRKALAIPGVSQVLEPTLDELTQKIAALAT